MYTFIFDRRSLTWLTIGTLFAAALLVAAGVVIGLQIDLPDESGTVATMAGDLSTIEKRLAPPPKAAPPPPPPPPPASPPPPSSASPPPPSSASPPPPPAAAPPPSTTAAPWPEPSSPPEPATVAEARIEEPLSAPVRTGATRAKLDEPSAAATVPAAFTVQVAAYAVEANARREAAALEERGYRPLVLVAPGAGGRPLHRVSIGSYRDRREAAEAARNFTASEGRESLVRPLDVL